MGVTQSGQLHQSKGLMFLRERLNLMNASHKNFFTIDSIKDKGTSITLKLDLSEFDD